MRSTTFMLRILVIALLFVSCGGSAASETSTTDDASATSTEPIATTDPVAMPTTAEEVATRVPATVQATPQPTTAETSAEQATTESSSTSTTAAAATATTTPAAIATAAPAANSTTAATAATSGTAAASSSCADTAALFVTKGSANPSLADPQVAAVCTGEQITINSNGIPDYTYIETSPGNPAAQNLTFTMPSTPTATTNYTAVPLIGPMAVALNGVPIYGPTEGQGGDVLSLNALSECGSHNGPTGFHMHLVGTSSTTDCVYTPAQVAAAPQLVGYAFDGYPIYTGNDQYTSSWTLTNASLFATDTWAAHSYVAGSGDLDQCNGRTDATGQYAYYTTDTFPYVLGCYAGTVDLAASGAGGGGGFGGPGAAQAPGGGNAAAPGGAPAGGPPAGGAPAGGAPAAAGQPDFTSAAAALGVTVEELVAALGDLPPDLEAAAAALGVTVAELEAVLPAPPG